MLDIDKNSLTEIPEFQKLSNDFDRLIQQDKIEKGKGNIQVLESLIEYADEFFEVAKIDPKNKPQCKAGCSYCCYLKVEVNRIELKRILDHYNSLPTGEKNQIKRKVLNASKKIERAKDKSYVELNIPCPFLKNNKCSIYSIRPLSCRAYNSVKVSDCKKGFKKVVKITREATQYMIFYAAFLALILNDQHFLDFPFPEDKKVISLVEGLAYFI